MLSGLLQKGLKALTRSVSDQRPPSARAAAKILTRAGWDIRPCYTDGFEFLATKDHTNIAVGMNYGDLKDLNFRNIPDLNRMEACTSVIVIAREPPPHIQIGADQVQAVLIHFNDLERVADHVSGLLRRTRDLYLMAKSNLRQKSEAEANESACPPRLSGSDKPIYTSKYTECVFVDRGGDHLLISFGNHQDIAGTDALIGAAACEQSGISLLCIRTFGPNWFPADDAAHWLETIQAVLSRFPKIWSLGAGQGGYAALRHARQLGCQRAIVISPTASIDLWDIEDGRYNRFFVDDMHHDMRIKLDDLSGEVILIHDPEDELDAKQAKLLPAYPEIIRRIDLPFAGAATSWLLLTDDTLPRVLRACINDDWRDLRQIGTQARKQVTDRPFTMAYALATRRPLTALALFQKHALPHKTRDWASVCFRLAKSGLAANVLPPIEAAAKQNPNDIQLAVTAALIALELPDPRKALDYIQIALNDDGRNESYLWIKGEAIKMLPPF